MREYTEDHWLEYSQSLKLDIIERKRGDYAKELGREAKLNLRGNMIQWCTQHECYDVLDMKNE